MKSCKCGYCCPKSEDTFDFIVAGAGVAGSIVASRLALAGWSVAVIDAGHNNTTNPLVVNLNDYALLYDNPFYQVTSEGYALLDPYSPISPLPYPIPYDELNYHLGNPDGTPDYTGQPGVVNPGTLNAIWPIVRGTGYVVGTPVIVSGGSPTVNATAHISSVDFNGGILAVDMDNIGAGYIHTDVITFTIGVGTGAVLHYFIRSEVHQQIQYPRGTGIGGGGQHYVGVYCRGAPTVYDEWAVLTGDKGWIYENVIKYFKKLESEHFVESNLRGKHGWMGVQKPPLSKISLDLFTSILANNIPVVRQFNTIPPGSSPSLYSGVGIMEFMVKYFRRSYSGVDLLLPTIEETGNITLFEDSLVTKVLFDDCKKCIGVEYTASKPHQPTTNTQNPYYVPISNPGTPDNDVDREPLIIKKLYCKKEVILSVGTFVSPQILMLSGIGPRSELKQFKIPILVRSEGVGQNLQEHMEVSVVYDLVTYNQQNEIFNAVSSPSDPSYGTVGLLSEVDSSGNGSNPTPADINGNIQLDWFSGAQIGEPDLHTQVIPFGVGNPTYNLKSYFPDLDPTQQYIFASIEHSYPSGRGSVFLQSKDPRIPMRVNLGLNSDDANVLASGILQFREYMDTYPINDPDRYFPVEVVPGKFYDDIPSLVNYLLSNSRVGHHASSTCSMGRRDDMSTPLDSKFRVKGVTRLRVIDLSAMPKLSSCNPTCPLSMMSERGADLILERWGSNC